MKEATGSLDVGGFSMCMVWVVDSKTTGTFVIRVHVDAFKVHKNGMTNSQSTY